MNNLYFLTSYVEECTCFCNVESITEVSFTHTHIGKCHQQSNTLPINVIP